MRRRAVDVGPGMFVWAESVKKSNVQYLFKIHLMSGPIFFYNFI